MALLAFAFLCFLVVVKADARERSPRLYSLQTDLSEIKALRRSMEYRACVKSNEKCFEVICKIAGNFQSWSLTPVEAQSADTARCLEKFGVHRIELIDRGVDRDANEYRLSNIENYRCYHLEEKFLAKPEQARGTDIADFLKRLESARKEDIRLTRSQLKN